MTPLTFSLAPDHLIAVGRANFLRSAKKQLPLVVAVALVFAIATAYPARLDAVGFLSSAITYLIVVIAAVAGFSALVLFWSIPRHARRTMKLHKSLQHPISLSWDEGTIRLNHRGGFFATPISDFAYWSNPKGHIVLFRSDTVYHILPSEAFDSIDQKNDLLSKIQAAGVRYR